MIQNCNACVNVGHFYNVLTILILECNDLLAVFLVAVPLIEYFTVTDILNPSLTNGIDTPVSNSRQFSNLSSFSYLA